MFKGNRNLLIIALIAVVNALGYAIIIPILVSYSKQYGLSTFENGLLFALFSICQFIATPIIGRLSDKYGRKPLLIGSISGTVVSFFMMAFAPNAIFLFIARALDGLTAGNIPVAYAVISDSTEPKDRAKGFGIVTASFSFGFIAGPTISALTVGYSTALPFIIAGIVSAIAVLMTVFFLPETNKHIGEVKQGKLFDFPKLWHTLFDPNVGVTFLITLFFMFAFACAIIFGYQNFAYEALKLNETQNSLLFTMFGIIGALSQAFLVNRFAKSMGIKRAFIVSLGFTTLSFIVMFFSNSLQTFIAASIILGLFNGMAQTFIPTILSQEVDAKSQGSIMGLNASYQSIGMIFGPIVGGLVASINVAFPFLVGIIAMLICFYLSFHVLKPNVKKESAF
jgi:MFS family permease